MLKDSPAEDLFYHGDFPCGHLDDTSRHVGKNCRSLNHNQEQNIASSYCVDRFGETSTICMMPILMMDNLDTGFPLLSLEGFLTYQYWYIRFMVKPKVDESFNRRGSPPEISSKRTLRHFSKRIESKIVCSRPSKEMFSLELKDSRFAKVVKYTDVSSHHCVIVSMKTYSFKRNLVGRNVQLKNKILRYIFWDISMPLHSMMDQRSTSELWSMIALMNLIEAE